tara:strand:- start:5040 stop:6266 length:1227 start_codon:yes stop_codon:yes gene_type:complete
MTELKLRTYCRSCGHDFLESILDLGNHPWCNNFLNKDELGKEPYYPLHLVHCAKCDLLQLNYTVPKEIMFKKHSYVSSTTKTLTKHFYDLAIENRDQFNLKNTDLIVDIGGNDGTQLLQYKNLGLVNLLNIESASNIAQLSVDNLIPTKNEFFNEKVSKDLFAEKSVKLINAAGVFFHLEELHSVLSGIVYALKDDGVFVVQFMYAGSMVDNLNFDTIYHEHLCYYTLNSLKNLISPYGLEIFDSTYSPIHSGSIIAKIGFKGKFQKTTRMLETELNDKKYNKNSFLEFSAKIQSLRYKLKELLIGIKQKEPSAKIYAYGAPAKGNTLLNYFDINKELVTKCAEVNQLKIGQYLPHTHIPIIQESSGDIPNYYLLLSHNFVDEILEKNLNLREKNVKFIIPFPKVSII